MKKITCIAVVVFALAAVVSAFAAPKKNPAKGGKGGADDISCASAWTKKAKDFEGKTVKTYILEIRSAGTVSSDAPAAVVPVQTGDKSQNPGGEIYVLVPAASFSDFCKSHQPRGGDADSSFGGKIEHKTLSAVFATVGGTHVLLYKIKADALADFSPETALVEQLKNAGEGSSAIEVPAGFTQKIFHVSQVGKKPYTPAEFKRLVALYNKDRPKSDRMKERDVKALLEDGGDPLVALDEKAKIQWILMR